MINKDFIKDILAGNRRVMKKSEVRFIKVPQYDELSVKNLWPEFKKDADFVSYFPATFPKGKGPPREYFFDILNTLHPEYLGQVLQHANEQRMSAQAEGLQREAIAITDFWA